MGKDKSLGKRFDFQNAHFRPKPKILEFRGVKASLVHLEFTKRCQVTRCPNRTQTKEIPEIKWKDIYGPKGSHFEPRPRNLERWGITPRTLPPGQEDLIHREHSTLQFIREGL